MPAALPCAAFTTRPQAYDLRDCRYVACKIHQLSSSWSAAKRNNYIKHATREYEIHKDLKHERIVELFGEA